MLSFSAKGATELIDVTVDFSNLLPANVNLATATVTAAVYDYSQVTDTSPASILKNAAQVNSTDYTTASGDVLAANKGVIQRLQNGVVNCTYVLTFTVTTSDGQTLVEQVTITIVQYIPA